jgi:hypothetical protein
LAKVPAGQVVAVKAQVVEPWGLKDPAAQGRQTEVELAPGVVEYVPAEQGVQVELSAAPGVVEYVPAEQGVHVELRAAPGVAL